MNCLQICPRLLGLAKNSLGAATDRKSDLRERTKNHNLARFFVYISIALQFQIFPPRAIAGESCFGTTYMPIDDTQGAVSVDYEGVSIMAGVYYDNCAERFISVHQVNTPFMGHVHSVGMMDFNLASIYNVVIRGDDPDRDLDMYTYKRVVLRVDLTSTTLPSLGNSSSGDSVRDKRFSGEDIVAATIYSAFLALSPGEDIPVKVELTLPEKHNVESWRRLEGVYHWDDSRRNLREGNLAGYQLKQTPEGLLCYRTEVKPMNEDDKVRETPAPARKSFGSIFRGTSANPSR